MGYVKLCCAAALGALAGQASADSSVFVRDSMHLMDSSTAPATLSEEDVSFLVARLAGEATPLESKPPAGLPVPCLFHETAGSAMLVVTGANIKTLEGSSTSFQMEDTSASPSEALTSLLTGNSGRQTVNVGVCASLCCSVADSCDSDATVVTWDPDTESFAMQMSEETQAITVDSLFGDSEFFNTIGLKMSPASAIHGATGISLDLTDPTTIQLLAELQLFNQLPALVNASSSSVAPFALLSLVGPAMFTETHGEDDVRVKAVDAIVATAAPIILDSWSALYSDDAYALSVFRQNAEPTVAARRRILTTASSNTTATGYTSAQVSEYQLFTWTWFLLLLIIFFAACSLGGLDIGRDDAGLYSTFKAGSYDRVSHEHDQ